MKILLDAGAARDGSFYSNTPPIYDAAVGNDPETLQVLIDAGANLDAGEENEEGMELRKV